MSSGYQSLGPHRFADLGSSETGGGKSRTRKHAKDDTTTAYRVSLESPVQHLAMHFGSLPDGGHWAGAHS